ncbi:MAG TPA: VCBS repeat-containing protein, partial [Thermoanaerobaculia bacterium]|nr:VCBS repeat-containing protein [Thermoanaerobaculia bacterium]
MLLAAGSAFADGGVTFSDIAAGGANGLHYSRVPSARYQTFLADIANGFMDVPTEYRPAPMKPYGAPGVALFDYDGDGDLDIFVTNGPGRGNSLFKNLLKETGHLQFVDVASQAGVALTGFDSQGVCFGDIDNDGNEDLLVLGYEGNHLFHNLGNGKFKDITASSGIGGSTNTSVSCSMGDINGDGLIDIVIANTFDFAHMNAITGEPLIHDQHNQVLINRGHNVFQDVSDSSGIKDIEGIPTPGAALITWAIALVDLDQDGNLDVVLSNDQRTYNFVPPNVGFNRFFRNDGTGHFTDVTAEVHLDRPGSWRGLAFGDLNCDGKLDLFATNIGDYVFFAGTNPVGKWSSAWFFGQADGTFQLGPPGSLVTVPIGWGAAIADY